MDFRFMLLLAWHLFFAKRVRGVGQDATRTREDTLDWYYKGGATFFYEDGSKSSGARESSVTGIEFNDALISKYGESAFAKLAELEEIQELTFRGDVLDDGKLEIIAAIPSLQKGLRRLRIGWRGDERRGRITGHGLQAIVAFKHLRELRLDGPKIDDSSIDSVVRLTELEALQLTNTAVTDAGIQKLNILNNLRSLILFSNDVKGATFNKLATLDSLLIVCHRQEQWNFRFSQDCRGIRELWLAGDVTASTFKSYAQSGGTPALRLSAANFSDDDLQLVKNASRLRQLRLDGTDVSGVLLRDLCNKMKLNVLDCRRCKNVTSFDIESIEAANRSMIFAY